MQKTSLQASILIWSIFLSLIISVSFVGISTQIHKNLKQNHSLKSLLSNQKTIQEKLKNKDFTNTELEQHESIIFQDANNYTISLKAGEIKNIDLGASSSNITLSLSSTGAIYYSGSTTSGIVHTSATIGGISGLFSLENLGGYAKVTIHSDNEISRETIKYKVVKKIGNKTIIKTQGEIQ